MSTPQDIFRDSVDALISNIHVSMPGIIVDYDASTSSATIQPALNKNYFSGAIEMPVIENVPVIFPSTSQFSLSFPLSAGDTVLLVFCERSIDLWKSVGGQLTPNDRRKFALSDAVAVPGLSSFNSNFSSRSSTDFITQYKGSQVRIQENGDIQIKTSGKIAIGNQVTEVLDVISSFLGDMISALYGSPPGPLDPATAASLGVLQTKIDALKGVIT